MLSAVIVVPCYNEASRLDSAAFCRFLACEPNVMILFVDDGSIDATAQVVESIRHQYPERVRLLLLNENHGKAEAVRLGINEAARFKPHLIGYWDADLATPLSEVAAMTALFADPDVGLVIGSRVRMIGYDVRLSAIRHYIGLAFATLASLQLRLPVYDTQCGAKVLRASPEIVALFSRQFRLRWCFDVELLARFDALSVRSPHRTCIEHPVSRWMDVGASKLTLRQVLRIIPELIRLPGVLLDERQRKNLSELR